MTVALLGPNGVDSVLLANPNNKAKTVDVSDLALDSFVKSRIGSAGGLNFRNKVVDGRFDFWYEGSTQSVIGYKSDTMWQNNHAGSTKVHSRQALVAGVDLPAIDCPTAKYFSRTVVTSVAGAGNSVTKLHKIEDVRTCTGKTVTVSFYAKADSAKSIGVSMVQDFGVGGSSTVYIAGQLVPLSSEWARYSLQFSLPSIAGKTITANSNLQLLFWFDGGSTVTNTYNMSGMVQQSGTFDLACVQLEEGSVMTPFEELPIEINQKRVERHAELMLVTLVTAIYLNVHNRYKTTKRATPAIKLITGNTYSGSVAGSAEPDTSCQQNVVSTQASDCIYIIDSRL